MRSSRHAGFTVIEMLALLAVLVVSVATILPLIAAGSCDARQTRSMSNLRQVSLMMTGSIGS